MKHYSEDDLGKAGLTEKEMQANVDTLSDEMLARRFRLEFKANDGYFNDGATLCCDTKDGLFVAPDDIKDVTDKRITEMMRECLKTGKNIFAEQWKLFVDNFPEGADY